MAQTVGIMGPVSDTSGTEGEQSRSLGRRRPSDSLPADPDADDIAAALLGRPRTLARRDVSSGANVSLLSVGMND